MPLLDVGVGKMRSKKLLPLVSLPPVRLEDERNGPYTPQSLFQGDASRTPSRELLPQHETQQHDTNVPNAYRDRMIPADRATRSAAGTHSSFDVLVLRDKVTIRLYATKIARSDSALLLICPPARNPTTSSGRQNSWQRQRQRQKQQNSWRHQREYSPVLTLECSSLSLHIEMSVSNTISDIDHPPSASTPHHLCYLVPAGRRSENKYAQQSPRP